MNDLDNIKKQIHTINPEISDELLDLLYKFVSTKLNNENLDLSSKIKSLPESAYTMINKQMCI